MNFPPKQKEQCHCQHCNIDRKSPFGSGDSLYHGGAQANYVNYINADLPTHDTSQMVRDNLHSMVDREIDKYSIDDWERLLKYYEHVGFNLRFIGWNKRPIPCICNMTTLSQKGCQCGGV